MLHELQGADFGPRIGELFEVHLAEGLVVPLRLTSVANLGAPHAPGGRRPFSLLFQGPPSPQFLTQGTYRLQNEGLGAFDLFIVPLGPEPVAPRTEPSQARRMQYEAIFN
jgi:hypothetical protein